jgi:hypothetical protein
VSLCVLCKYKCMLCACTFVVVCACTFVVVCALCGCVSYADESDELCQVTVFLPGSAEVSLFPI